MIAIFDLLKAFPVEKTWSAVAIGPAGPQPTSHFLLSDKEEGEERLRDPFPLQSPLHYCSVCNEVVEGGRDTDRVPQEVF